MTKSPIYTCTYTVYVYMYYTVYTCCTVDSRLAAGSVRRGESDGESETGPARSQSCQTRTASCGSGKKVVRERIQGAAVETLYLLISTLESLARPLWKRGNSLLQGVTCPIGFPLIMLTVSSWLSPASRPLFLLTRGIATL